MPDNLNQYIISMGVSILVSVALTLSKPADAGDTRRHYQIKNATLSDMLIREIRTSPQALPDLCRGYRQTRRTMVGVVIGTVLVLTVLCACYYTFL